MNSRRQNIRLLSPPEYIRKAIDGYKHASSSLADHTVALAIATVKFASELGTDGNTRQVVSARVAKLVERPDLISRLTDIADCCEELVAEGKSIAGVKSQGALFALVAARNAAKKKTEPIDLDSMLHDAKTLSISKFRGKWNNDQKKTKKPNNETLTLEEIVLWLKTASLGDVQEVQDAAGQRLKLVNTPTGSTRSDFVRLTK